MYESIYDFKIEGDYEKVENIEVNAGYSPSSGDEFELTGGQETYTLNYTPGNGVCYKEFNSDWYDVLYSIKAIDTYNCILGSIFAARGKIL